VIAGRSPTAGASSRRHPKSRRLRARSEFLAAQATGVRVHTPHFLLVVARSPDAEAPARLGITVTRKVGDAVRRNRVKRVVREVFRLDPSWLPAGVDLLVIAKNGAPTLGLVQVREEWSRARTQLQRRAREVLAQKRTDPASG
jgi:ribonuclease P protein component